MRVVITGRPGIGKTTIAVRVATAASRDMRIAGFVTIEVRRGGARLGFVVRDIATGEEDTLAWVGEGEPRVGRYAVRLEACGLMERAVARGGDLLVVDEVGPMELKCPNFEGTILTWLETYRHALLVVHRSLAGAFAGRIGARLIEVTAGNRDRLVGELLAMLRG